MAKKKVRKQAGLDFFLISDYISQFVMDSQIIFGYRTDHNSIILKLKLHENDSGKESNGSLIICF